MTELMDAFLAGGDVVAAADVIGFGADAPAGADEPFGVVLQVGHYFEEYCKATGSVLTEPGLQTCGCLATYCQASESA